MTSERVNWQQACLPLQSKVSDAIKVLNSSAIKLVLVTDSMSRLIGTISDGDIRRGFLRNVTMDSSISEVICSNPVTVQPETTIVKVKNLMVMNKIQNIPIVSDDMKVVGIHNWHSLSFEYSKKNIMVIMAGGKGTRLLPATKSVPKPMIEIAGKPILEHIIDQAKLDGIHFFKIAIHHLGEKIEEYFGDGRNFGVEIEYLREKSPLGTAGALGMLDSSINEPILVTNGDVITKVRYGDIIDYHTSNESMATMAVQHYIWQNPYGVVEVSGIEISGYQEKPHVRSLVNAGVYVLNPEVISDIPTARVINMPEVFEKARNQGKRTLAYPIHESWMDVGRPEDLMQASSKFSERTAEIR